MREQAYSRTLGKRCWWCPKARLSPVVNEDSIVESALIGVL